ncbi:hypothetical protein BX600DRAFT_518318 [Xylariales sp. PMI_506]|nr:hypothetical protein BX600DRAFT_518318 [Xylariales sp. PMI_506]
MEKQDLAWQCTRLLEAAAADSDLPHEEILASRKKIFPLAPHLHIAILYGVIFILSVSLIDRAVLLRPLDPSQGIFSPAETAIRYKTVTFQENFATKGMYMGSEVDGLPTDATDQLWDELYNFGTSWINSNDAQKLPNSTLSLPHDPNKFVVQLDVFHQLHCLNSIRKTLYPERYRDKIEDYYTKTGERNYTSIDAKHYDHCIDSLRQSIMCHGDIATVYWRYNEVRRIPLPQLAVTHTCRDFDLIKEWALERQLFLDELHWDKGDEADFN